MPQPVVFNNKQIVEPGAFSQIIGAAPAVAALDTFGSVMIVDTGLGNGFVGRSGIVGTVDNAGDAVYVINSLKEGQQLMRGGILYDLMSYLFSPSLAGNGPKTVYFARAATTVAAGVTLTFNNGRTVRLITRHEGVVGNGLLTSGVLTRGFAAKLLSGVLDTTKFVMTMYSGQFKGLDVNGVPYDNSEAILATNNLFNTLSKSKEVSTFYDLLTYFQTDPIFNQDFKYISTADPITVLGRILTLNAPAASSGGIAGTYLNVPLTGGTGTGAIGTVVVAAGGTFSSVTITTPGINYVVGDVLSCVNTNIGGGTAVLAVSVATVSVANTADFALTAADITALSSYQLFSGGTTQYASARVDDVLANIVDLDFDQFLCTDYGGVPIIAPTAQNILDGANLGAMSVNNAKLLAYMSVQSLYTLKSMYVGGGNDNDGFDNPSGNVGSIQIAAYYNSALVQVVHSGPKIINSAGALISVPLSIYTAALVCGRVAGLEPQIPVTYKDIRVAGMVHVLSQPQREKALLYGVLHMKNVTKLGWVVNQGVDTLQTNASNIYSNGTSPSVQIMRIFHQLNKELVMNAATRFPGGNLNSVSAQELKSFTEGYLLSRTIQPDKDDLLISFRNVTAVYANSKWSVTYCATPNSEVDQVFFTGIMLDPNIQA